MVLAFYKLLFWILQHQLPPLHVNGFRVHSCCSEFSCVFSRKRLKRSHLSETMSSGYERHVSSVLLACKRVVTGGGVMCCRDGVQATQQEPGCGDKLLRLKIRAQLEEMFTDAHLAEDGFLLKHLQSRHGFVSLKLLTCLKKVTLSA